MRLVWACPEQGCRVCWEEDTDYGAAGQEKRKVKDEVYVQGDICKVRENTQVT